MAVFEYKAMDLDSSAVSGTITADTPRQARDRLREQGLAITEIRSTQPARSRRWSGWSRPGAGASRGGRKAQVQVVAFIRELATLLRAGITLLAALQTLSRQHRRPLGTVIEQLGDQVASGTSLS